MVVELRSMSENNIIKLFTGKRFVLTLRIVRNMLQIVKKTEDMNPAGAGMEDQRVTQALVRAARIKVWVSPTKTSGAGTAAARDTQTLETNVRRKTGSATTAKDQAISKRYACPKWLIRCQRLSTRSMETKATQTNRIMKVSC